MQIKFVFIFLLISKGKILVKYIFYIIVSALLSIHTMFILFTNSHLNGLQHKCTKYTQNKYMLNKRINRDQRGEIKLNSRNM